MLKLSSSANYSLTMQDDEDEEDEENEGEGGLSKSGKELKKLLRRTGGLNDSDGEDDDDDDDVRISFDFCEHNLTASKTLNYNDPTSSFSNRICMNCT